MNIKKLFLKTVLLLLIANLAIPEVAAQQPSLKFMVSFTDKNGTPYQTGNPQVFLSQRAIDRRLKFSIPVTVHDLPVTPAYLDSISGNGVKFLASSKWFNAALIEVSDSMFAMDLLSFPFVSAVDLLYLKDSVKRTTIKHGSMAANEMSSDYLELLSGNKSVSDGISKAGINYGFSFAQVNMLGANYLHQLGFTGDSMVIAVLDAGFSMTDFLPVFDSLFHNNRILSTMNFAYPNESVYSRSQHGTMVLSTMGGNLPGAIVGTAPHASYHLLLSEDVMSEFPVEEFYWGLAAEYADSAGADMINSSLGYTTYDLPVLSHSYSDMDGKTTLSARAATFASSKGMLVVTSAGNGGGGSWHYISSPGDADSVLTVGGVDVSGQYAPFSSTGPSFDQRVKPDVAAVGFGATISSSSGGATYGNGTSFSSPIMCGAVACLWQANPHMSNIEIIEAVRKSGHQYTFPDTLLGYGIPNLAIAHLIIGGEEIPDIRKEKQIRVAPNPFYQHLLVTFFATDTQQVMLELYDITGKLCYSTTHRKNIGMNVVHINDIERLKAGPYILKIVDGNNVITEKVIRK